MSLNVIQLKMKDLFQFNVGNIKELVGVLMKMMENELQRLPVTVFGEIFRVLKIQKSLQKSQLYLQQPFHLWKH